MPPFQERFPGRVSQMSQTTPGFSSDGGTNRLGMGRHPSRRQFDRKEIPRRRGPRKSLRISLRTWQDYKRGERTVFGRKGEQAALSRLQQGMDESDPRPQGDQPGGIELGEAQEQQAAHGDAEGEQIRYRRGGELKRDPQHQSEGGRVHTV